MSYEETQLDETPPGELENQRTFAGTVSSNLTHAVPPQTTYHFSRKHLPRGLNTL